MKIVLAIVTLSLAVLSASAQSVRGGERILTSDGKNDSDYKYIEVFDESAKKDRCWEAVEDNSGYYYVYAKDCNHSNYAQDWYYSKEGEIKNRKYDNYCVHYDIYKKNYYDYLVLEKCNGGGANQRWNYIDEHFASHYNGYCIDLSRVSGNKFETKKCDKNLKDQKHKVENYWFYGW